MERSLDDARSLLPRGHTDARRARRAHARRDAGRCATAGAHVGSRDRVRMNVLRAGVAGVHAMYATALTGPAVAYAAGPSVKVALYHRGTKCYAEHFNLADFLAGPSGAGKSNILRLFVNELRGFDTAVYGSGATNTVLRLTTPWPPLPNIFYRRDRFLLSSTRASASKRTRTSSPRAAGAARTG